MDQFFIGAGKAAIATAIVGIIAAIPAACHLSATDKARLAAAEPGILAGDAAACSETAMIPVVGAAIAAVACPLEVAIVKAAIDAEVAASPDAGAPAVGQSVMLATVYRTTDFGRRVAIGRVAVSVAPGVQRRIDGGKGGGR